MLLTFTGLKAQQQGGAIITGKVYEMLGNQKELAFGVNVFISNDQNRILTGTTTNHLGEYSLRLPNVKGELTVVFSFIGMKQQTVKYTGQKIIDVTMEEDSKSLSEVVVTTERSQRSELGISQREQTFASQRIKMDEIVADMPVASVEEALQGRLGGVDIIAGGDPGAKSSIRIRGTATLNSSADPLIVINGVPYSTEIDEGFDFATANTEDFADMLNLNPYDIESIEVLKDAASTAVYGTKGANGVLLITTKKGSKGKTKFSFSTKFTGKFEPEAIPMLNGDQYVAFIQDAMWNTANARGLSNSGPLLKLLFSQPEINYNEDWRYFNEYNTNTDWMDYVKQNAFITDNSFSMSGGGDKATYRFSLSYLNEGGTTVGTGLDRFTSSLNVGYNFSDKLRVDADFTYTDSETRNNWSSKTRAEALKKMPNKSPYWIDPVTGDATNNYFIRQNSEEFQGAFSSKLDGSNASNFHPIIMANESYNNSSQKEERMNFRVNYKILPELTYTGYVSIKFKTVKTKKFLPQDATGVTIQNVFANQSYDGYSNNLALQTENKFLFRKNWNDKHSIVATALWRTSQSTSSNYYTIIYGAPSSSMSDPVTGGTIYEMYSGDSEVRTLSGVGNFNYTFLNRYTFNATFNYEGKSSLGKDNRWGLFPSYGFAWHLGDEAFMEKLDWLDEFKVRASYGESGQSPSGTAPYIGTYTSLGQYINNSSVAPSTMQLNKLKWESSRESDIGVDISAINRKISLTFDYYYKYTKDLLQKNITIPTSVGYNSSMIAWFTAGELSNRGWEFRIDYEVFKSKDWQLSLNYNISRNENQIEKLPVNLTQENYSFGNGNYGQKNVIGTPSGSFFGFRYAGVYQTAEDTYARDEDGNIMTDLNRKPIVMKNGTYTCFPGDAKYEDINHDGIIDENDIVYLGNCMPTVSGGAGFVLKYKRFSLTTFFHYRLGQKVINQARMDSESMYGTNNQSKAVLKRWRNPGDDTDIPRALWNYGYNYLGSDRFVEDCSYIRLKTVSLNYSFPKEFCTRLRTNSISAFITGYDLFTWTKYTGQDPEVSLPGKVTDLAKDNAQTPRSMRVSAGVNINF